MDTGDIEVFNIRLNNYFICVLTHLHTDFFIKYFSYEMTHENIHFLTEKLQLDDKKSIINRSTFNECTILSNTIIIISIFKFFYFLCIIANES